jgi:CRISPR-associated exonuclease Cas4
MDSVIVNISSLEHYAYCPRQCALIDVEGQWIDNRHTAFGSIAHERVDSGKHSTERGRQVLRSIPLWSETYGIAGRADAVEFDGQSFVPVEYKSGVRHGDAADIQLCAQALCLEEMFGVVIDEGFVWYSGPRRRHRVEFDESLRGRTIAAALAIRSMIESGSVPAAAADRRCDECQLEPRCLPHVVVAPERALELTAALLAPELS